VHIEIHMRSILPIRSADVDRLESLMVVLRGVSSLVLFNQRSSSYLSYDLRPNLVGGSLPPSCRRVQIRRLQHMGL
jgi:hypothetical protein